MVSFIHEVIIDLQSQKANLSKITFVLPSKRAGLFLRETISKLVDETIFAPDILSIEEFVEKISNYQYALNAELLFQFYESYLKHTPEKDREPFDKFSKWATILIQDFNEIDRFLIEQDKVFEYLSAIKEIEHQHWSLDESPTQYVQNYLLFWKRLKLYYHELRTSLSEKKLGYQGMVYRDAAENIDRYIIENPKKQHVFLGFNALNASEEKIIQKLLSHQLANIYWDIDQHFLNNTIHDAGLFIRSHLKNWSYFKNNPIKWCPQFYSEEKHIEIIGTPKNIGQIKYVGELLSKLKLENHDLKKTALVLGNETLLLPLLNSIPQSIDRVNITMGLPLQFVPLASLFEDLFRLHQKQSPTIYYKDILGILNNQYVNVIIDSEDNEGNDAISAYIATNNISYITPEKLQAISKLNEQSLKLLFSNWNDNPTEAISNCKELILKLKAYFDSDKEKHALALEYLFKFFTVFNELDRLNSEFNHVDNIRTLYGLYKELIKNETLDFQGEPLEGLQIMGMLETRVLDFETVIITSVNEGILPAGKSNNSFIPFDVKLENKLPTYKEKDAVYTYHFYRMLQRAKNIYILYNTEPDVLNGGEKSRFITQLLTENIHNVNHQIVSPRVPVTKKQLRQIPKTPSVITKLDELAVKGLSPSSLTNYIRNPMNFYLEKILGISEYTEVEEHVAYNTLGTVIHNTLEDFYKPLEGRNLTVDSLKKMKNQISDTVRKHFKIEFKQGDISKGKNLIIFEIAKRYINNFLNLELLEVKTNTIKIIAIETKNKVPLYIEQIDKTINLTGKVDRVDEYNGTIRIIDYKSGRVEPGKVEIVNWEDILTDYDKYSKSFQVLMYAFMMYKSKQIVLPVEGGIISFKSLNSGLLKFATKPSSNSRKKNQTISLETLEAFEVQLKLLISEIYNPEINFLEKEVS